MKYRSKNTLIEFLRFVFASIIVLFHINNDFKIGKRVFFVLGPWNAAFFSKGNLGVEFFFLVSGILMAKACFKQQTGEFPLITRQPLGEETAAFILKKAKTIFRYYLPACFITLVLHLLRGNDLMNIIWRIPSLFLLHRTGIIESNFIGVSWYLSSMIIAMCILYPLCLRYYKTFTMLIAPVGSILIIGALIHNYGSLGGGLEWTVITYKCNIRAIAEISMGAACFEAGRRLKERSLSFSKRLCLSIAAFFAIILSIIYICSTAATDKGGVILLLMAFGLTVIFSGISVLADTWIYHNRVFHFLGAISLPLYLMQNVARTLVPILLAGRSLKAHILGVYLSAVLFGILLHLAVTFVMKKKQERR